MESRDIYKGIDGWFTQTTADALDALIEEHDIKSVIEIGSFLGRSTAFFASRVDHVTAIDPFIMWKEGGENGDAIRWGGEKFFDSFHKNTSMFTNIKPIVGTSEYVADWLPDLRADLVYIDASHDYDSVVRDIKLWMPRANKIISGDDFSDAWPDVGVAVAEIVPDYKVVAPLWYGIIK